MSFHYKKTWKIKTTKNTIPQNISAKVKINKHKYTVNRGALKETAISKIDQNPWKLTLKKFIF